MISHECQNWGWTPGTGHGSPFQPYPGPSKAHPSQVSPSALPLEQEQDTHLGEQPGGWAQGAQGPGGREGASWSRLPSCQSERPGAGPLQYRQRLGRRGQWGPRTHQWLHLWCCTHRQPVGCTAPHTPVTLYEQGGRPRAVPPSGQACLWAEGAAAQASGGCPGHWEVCSSGCLAPLGCRWARSLCPGQHQATTWKGSSVPSELPEVGVPQPRWRGGGCRLTVGAQGRQHASRQGR